MIFSKFDSEHDRNALCRVLHSILQLSLKKLPLEQLLQDALNEILHTSFLEIEKKGAIFLKEDGQDTLVLKAWVNFGSQMNTCAKVKIGQCLCGQAALIKKVVFCNEINGEHTIGHDNLHNHGHYCIPIIFNDEVSGVLNTYVKEGHTCSEVELDFLQAISNLNFSS
ncbi:MAG: GAF domain-containing protein [Bacteriovoracaceae bacterium]|nr:GAF domain-containing protein [Bacteriovoracaceae bacterium]